MAKKKNDPNAVVAELLAAFAVTRLVYVDDVFAATADRVEDLCRELTVEEIAKANVFTDVGMDVDDEDVLRQKISRSIRKMDRPDLQQAFVVLSGIKKGDGIREDLTAVKAFRELLPANFEIELLSLTEWRREEVRLITEAGQRPTLFVFDDDFRHEGFSEKEGRRLMVALAERHPEALHPFALLTHKASDEAGEEAVRSEIIAEYPDLQDSIVVIAKRNLTRDQSRFSVRLKLAVLGRHFKRLKARLKEALRDAQDRASKEIEELDIESFERIIFRSSALEGAWAPETIMRLYAVFQEKEASRRICCDDEIHEIVGTIDPICKVPVPPTSSATKERAVGLQMVGIYDDAAHVNSAFSPITLGDIFESTASMSRKFVLLAQPCDLIVRSNGYRRSKERDRRQMIALAEINSFSNGKRLYDAEKAGRVFRLPYFDRNMERTSCAEINCVHWIPSWLLDLAVLNPDGRCEISDRGQGPARLIPTWRRRKEVLYQTVLNVVEADRRSRCNQAGRSEELLGLVRLPVDTPIIATVDQGDGHAPESAWRFEIDLQRVGRLREPYASALLSQFGAYFSRVAYPHDLTRIEE